MSNDDWKSATDPGAQAAIDSILRDEPVASPRPEIHAQPDSYVRLLHPIEVDGERLTEVEVKELTGEDEERISKAKTSSDPTRFYNAVLESGVVDLDEDVLPKLLVGDREEILLGIRKATYGPEVELGTIFCPECSEEFEGVLNVDDIPRRPLKGETTFKVDMRKGGKANVRLPTGADQIASVKEPGLTDAQRDSIMLSHCVITLPVNGEDELVAAYQSLVLNLGIVDRRKILSEVNKRQPGPRYDEVEIEHECGARIPVLFGMGALFPGL